MRATLLAGLALSFVTALSAPALATGFRQSPAQGARLYKVTNNWVVRASLPGHQAQAAQRIAALKQSMEDEIEGVGHFQNDADTPAFEVVAHNANLHQIAEAGYGGANSKHNGGVARYQVKAGDLKGGALDLTVLLPVSGHVGLSSAQQYAKSNVFRLQVNGGKWENVAAKGQYITEKALQLKLNPGLNTIMMEPYAGGFGGYTQGRTVEIELVP